MKRLILSGLMAASALAGSAYASDMAPAFDEAGAFYVSPMAQYNRLDKHRNANDGYGWDVGLGFNVTRNFAAELNYSQFSTPHRAGGAGLRLYEYSIDGLWKFLPGAIVDPYLIVGVGGLDDVVPHYGHTSTAAVEGGGGVMIPLGPQGGAFRVQLRAEAKYRRELILRNYDGVENPSDMVYGLGFVAMFGGNRPAPAPKQVALPPPDSDGDGVTDDIDRCPNTPAGAKVDQYGCEFDEDGDGVVDRLDKCPGTPKGTPVDASGCPLDSDGDGVVDTLDKCPNTPKGDKVDSVGCTIKDEIKLQGVNFATGSAELVPESDFVLSYAVATLKKYPNVVIEVRGHTDNKGSKKLNKKLSQKRAESVMAYLQSHGVTNTMTAKGYGEEHPIADNKTADGRLENRRVTLHIESGL